MLQALGSELRALVTQQNGRAPSPGVQPISQNFVRAGQLSRLFPKKRPRSCLLDGATDWQILVDFKSAQIVFPPEIYSTSERPDIIVWSPARRQVLLVELTCPAEENMELANIRKATKYADLATECRLNGWTVHLMPVEVGARGFVGKSTSRCLTRFGLAGPNWRRAIQQLSSISARCSHAIYMANSSPEWDESRQLLGSSGADSEPGAQSSNAVSLVAAAPDPAAACAAASLVAAVAARVAARRISGDGDGSS